MPTWYHLVSSSGSGLVKNPPTSAPQKGSPATLMERIMGREILRWSHAALLSPVQMAPYRPAGWVGQESVYVCVCVCVCVEGIRQPQLILYICTSTIILTNDSTT